jgi:hypothetical protein
VEEKQKEENLLLLRQNANTDEYRDEKVKLVIDEHNDRVRKATAAAAADSSTPSGGSSPSSQPTQPASPITIEPVSLVTPNKTLHNEQEVNEYIAGLKQQIMAKLIEGKQAVIIM